MKEMPLMKKSFSNDFMIQLFVVVARKTSKFGIHELTTSVPLMFLMKGNIQKTHYQ